MPPTQSPRSPPGMYILPVPGVQDDVAKKLGFEKVSEEFIGDCNSNAVLLRHKKTGAQIMSLSNTHYFPNDTVSSLPKSLLFQVMQNDSTGVATILQQSVICGSRKYPLKRPFDELVLKSFSTYMYCKVMADRTYYSGNCTTIKELHNFVDLLLDAVFFPNCVEDIQIFWQQGLLMSLTTHPKIYLIKVGHLMHVPNSLVTYNFDHAGDPQIMPQLTFEDFKFVIGEPGYKRHDTGGISVDPVTSSVRCKKDPCAHIIGQGKVMAGRAEDLFKVIESSTPI
ncbi:presequence protease 1 [Pyrus ussuriensis x Pyrus communis]|uniref:Presequence protease 1 n=1 Tax=Pyrus ussuriensis x Pyrus communis TaxID=2448454 RepID=A0A5N5IBC5_9ROSA|nr:presequence protease 1 [Pyrus ussuriensis x Pyrus communis]